MDAHATTQATPIHTDPLLCLLPLANDNLENELASKSCVSRETFGEGTLLFWTLVRHIPLLAANLGSEWHGTRGGPAFHVKHQGIPLLTLFSSCVAGGLPRVLVYIHAINT